MKLLTISAFCFAFLAVFASAAPPKDKNGPPVAKTSGASTSKRDVIAASPADGAKLDKSVDKNVFPTNSDKKSLPKASALSTPANSLLIVSSAVKQCMNEVESRGMNERLYLINGISSEVKTLKEKFMKGGKSLDLSKEKIETICSTMKDLLRSMDERLITLELRKNFVNAIKIKDKQSALYDAISKLPQPNREILASVMVHLQKVSKVSKNKMDATNLVTVFGPTLVGFSGAKLSQEAEFAETSEQLLIVNSLLNIPSDYWAQFVGTKTQGHDFREKREIMPRGCEGCDDKIRFRELAAKCKNCKVVVHSDCKDHISSECVPKDNTPGSSVVSSKPLADPAARVPPLVLSAIQRCMTELELRGLTQEGLYRIPGSLDEIKSLKEKFLKGVKGPNLSKEKIETLSSLLKDFFRTLDERLISEAHGKEFVLATQVTNKASSKAALDQAMFKLPQSDRNILASLILHLQNVSKEKFKNKMGIDNLAMVFGPTLVDIDPKKLTASKNAMKDTEAVVKSLLETSSDYWAKFAAKSMM